MRDHSRRRDGPGMPKLSILIASTRPGRAGVPLAEWVAARAREHGAFDVEIIDLAEVDLPFMDEPHHPMLRRYEREHTKAWSARIDAADAFVFVTPEYNSGFTAPLKNAIDYLHAEWQYKPVAFTSYGGVSAGTRAVQMLKQVVTTLKMLPLVEAVNVPFHPQFIDEHGVVHANDIMEQAAKVMLDELAVVEAGMRPRRDAARAAA
jgi:NAD(P)H-dependent FMN reductase